MPPSRDERDFLRFLGETTIPRREEDYVPQTSFRIPADLLAKLDAEADRCTISRNKLVVDTLAALLGSSESDERWHDPGGRFPWSTDPTEPDDEDVEAVLVMLPTVCDGSDAEAAIKALRDRGWVPLGRKP